MNLDIRQLSLLLPVPKGDFTVRRSTARSLRLRALSALLGAVGLSAQAQTVLEPQTVLSKREAPGLLALVINRETLERSGARDLAAALAQLPGVVLDRSGEAEGDPPRLSLRGMTGGYTLVRVNGLPMKTLGPGIALDGLTLDRVERVEVRTAQRAADGGEAVAGIIDVVLRESAPPGARLSAALLPRGARTGAEVGWRQGWVGQGWQAQLGAIGRDAPSAWTDRLAQHIDFAGTSVPPPARMENTLSRQGSDRTLALDATLQAVSDNQDWQLKLMRSADDSAQRTATRHALHQAPFPPDDEGNDLQWTERRVTELASARWRHHGTTTLSVDTWLRRDRNDSAGQQLAVGTAPDSADRWADQQNEREWRLAATLERELTPNWALSAGTQLGASVACTSSEGDESPQPCQRRRQPALWGELQWKPNPKHQLVLGLRREGSRLDGIASPRDDVFILPNLSWQQTLNAAGTLRLEAALARTMRLPRLRELHDGVRERAGTPGNPDLLGNPELRPERVNGAELALAGSLAEAWTGRVGVFGRHINDAMQPVLSPTADGRWQQQTRNVGHVRSTGLELSAEGRLGSGWQLSFNQAFYQSTVEALPAPDNRLVGQPPARTTLSLQGRAAAWQLNAALRWQPGYAARTTAVQTLRRDAELRLDLGAQTELPAFWNTASGSTATQAQTPLRLRIGVTDIGPHSAGSELVWTDEAGNGRRSRFMADRPPVLRVSLDWQV
ncbi:TonB-dependent receptor [Paucibacter sp. AS339]|uniref:TonB-dependent receptor plug domain-containing protein n=1 Tax=Paucibacter hankyongi TaxID=3133434 RepID=UPI0030B145C5